ncbi:evolved d-pantonohydrolase [Kockovaella imperatae]|uniref:Evolved d-pantonohydrolase n=1 Tax=Kockovaella imperatae TaxID=4999 RepID=A0A1Y1U7K3_9TREE|nr:evolved d-pantonohydrolase [Kockovaella imperatae]ORX33988.1 evolved d-pantonohydrolase [Kockovaella imperatae]
MPPKPTNAPEHSSPSHKRPRLSPSSQRTQSGGGYTKIVLYSLAFLALQALALLTSPTYIEAYALPLLARLGFKRDLSGPSPFNTHPANSQVINLLDSKVLPVVSPPTEHSISDIFVPPGSTFESLLARPFHVYDPEFYAIIGSRPTLTRIAHSPIDPLYHEAVVWWVYPPTDEVFFCQNAGAKDAGTGAKKSAIVQKISLSQAAQAASAGIQNNTGVVKVETVASDPPIINPNGATNYRGQIVFAAEGQNQDKASEVVMLNPLPPYNTSSDDAETSAALLNNFFGRQFNSINDLAVHPVTKDLHFTDVTYGWLQHFRPSPNLPNQVYRYVERSGLIQVVADGFNKPNGITFSPDGKWAYIADTGAAQGYRFPSDPTLPTTIYRYRVNADGSWSERSVFAFVSPGLPDGIHCDTKGNLYAGCGDGVQVFNPSGKLIGKIFVGGTVANFQFALNRMVICAETSLWYAELGIEGVAITDL